MILNYVKRKCYYLQLELLNIIYIVDCMLYLEGDKSQGNVRMLRATKNRFGSLDEDGVYELDISPLHGRILIYKTRAYL